MFGIAQMNQLEITMEGHSILLTKKIALAPSCSAPESPEDVWKCQQGNGIGHLSINCWLGIFSRSVFSLDISVPNNCHSVPIQELKNENILILNWIYIPSFDKLWLKLWCNKPLKRNTEHAWSRSSSRYENYVKYSIIMKRRPRVQYTDLINVT